MTNMIQTLKPNGYLPLTIGKEVRLIAGGPYHARPKGFLGVKMAAEIDAPCDISVPTQDYSVPEVQVARMALLAIIPALVEGKNIYVGCMGGIGRTGLFMGLLARLVNPSPKFDAKAYVRATYLGHAIERPSQEKFIKEFPIQDLARYLAYYQRVMKRLGGV